MGIEGGDKESGGKMQSKKDPANSESHGHMSGIRRNSAAESSSAKH